MHKTRRFGTGSHGVAATMAWRWRRRRRLLRWRRTRDCETRAGGDGDGRRRRLTCRHDGPAAGVGTRLTDTLRAFAVYSGCGGGSAWQVAALIDPHRFCDTPPWTGWPPLPQHRRRRRRRQRRRRHHSSTRRRATDRVFADGQQGFRPKTQRSQVNTPDQISDLFLRNSHSAG